MEKQQQPPLSINFKAFNKINKSSALDAETKSLLINTVNNIVSEGNYNTYQEKLLRDYKIIK